MNTPQVSLWVPIAVGIIGLIGVISGQLVNAWREDRRWTREQEREDLRWKREQEKDALARSAADRAHWRDKKFEIYTELHSFMKAWLDQLAQAIHATARGGELPPKVRDFLQQADGNYFDHRDKVELIATDPNAQTAMLEAMKAYLYFTADFLYKGHPDWVSPDHFLDDVHEIVDDVVSAIRADLGISHERDTVRSPHVVDLNRKE